MATFNIMRSLKILIASKNKLLTNFHITSDLGVGADGQINSENYRGKKKEICDQMVQVKNKNKNNMLYSTI